jgi:hypothetical protein
MKGIAGNSNLTGRLSTVDLLINVACIAKNFAISKGAQPNKLVQGGQVYRAFPFSKASLGKVIFLLSFHLSLLNAIINLRSKELRYRL